jgi:TolB-like protein/class 3 adenylate cyclase
MSEVGGKRKLTTILAADVVGYSRLVAADDEAAIRRFQDLRGVIAGIVARHDGRLFGAAGDSLMAEFPSAVEAVRCALEIQNEIAQRNAGASAEHAMLFRIGINLGETIIEGDNLFGDGVNIAARLQEIADPGGFVLSTSAYDQIKNKVAVEMEPLGPRTLKNIPEPVVAFRARVGSARPVAAPPASGGWRRRAFGGGVALLAVIGAYVAWDAVVAPGSRLEAFRAQAALPVPRIPSIVVMPFVNASESEAQEFFCLGIAEDILTSLTKVSGLFVVGRDSAMSYKGKTVPARQVGRELGVRYVLQGSVRRADNRVRISTYLIDAATEQTVWAQRYDRELGDIFAVQDDIAGKVVQSLAVNIQPQERESIRQQLALAPKATAYEIYVKGRQIMIPPSPGNLDKAEVEFKNAIAQDPDFSGGYAGLSRVNSLRILQGLTTPEKDGTLDQARRNALRAEEIDRAQLKGKRSAVTLMSMASARLLEGDAAAARDLAKEAFDDQSQDPYVAATYGLMLTFAGQPERAYHPLGVALYNERLPAYQARLQVFQLYAAYNAEDYRTAIEAYEAHVKAGGACFLNCLTYAIASKMRRAEELNTERNLAEGNRLTAEATTQAQQFRQRYPNYREQIQPWLKLHAREKDRARFLEDVEKIHRIP